MKDFKYLAAFSIPVTALISIHYQGIWSFFTPVFAFILLPLLELVLPVDNQNLSQDQVDSKLKNGLFDWLLYLNFPLVYGILVFALITISQQALQTFEFIGIVLSTGIVLGVNGINVGHELGHRQQSPERYLGKLLLLPSMYMHFYIEHNFGHHLHAATKEDPATARYNQTLYSFWVTSVARQYVGAWKIQLNLLKMKKHRFFSLYNDLFWYVLLQLAFLILVYGFFGSQGLLLDRKSVV